MVDGVNQALTNLCKMLNTFCRTIFEKVLHVMKIENGCGGWISKTTELKNVIPSLTPETVNTDAGLTMALKGAFACTIFQKFDNNYFGRAVITEINEQHQLTIDSLILNGSSQHCFVVLARATYDRYSSTVLNELRLGDPYFGD